MSQPPNDVSQPPNDVSQPPIDVSGMKIVPGDTTTTVIIETPKLAKTMNIETIGIVAASSRSKTVVPAMRHANLVTETETEIGIHMLAYWRPAAALQQLGWRLKRLVVKDTMKTALARPRMRPARLMINHMREPIQRKVIVRSGVVAVEESAKRKNFGTLGNLENNYCCKRNLRTKRNGGKLLSRKRTVSGSRLPMIVALTTKSQVAHDESIIATVAQAGPSLMPPPTVPSLPTVTLLERDQHDRLVS